MTASCRALWAQIRDANDGIRFWTWIQPAAPLFQVYTFGLVNLRHAKRSNESKEIIQRFARSFGFNPIIT